MPKTIETVVYQFKELNDKAKEKARAWYLEATDDCEFAFEDQKTDAEEIGLKIEFLSAREPNSGSFIYSAIKCAESIIANHGDDCDTYKAAKAFIVSTAALNAESDDYEDAMETLEKEFLHAILEDYRVNYEKDCEYRQSDEYVDETIEANDYTFTESGKRFG